MPILLALTGATMIATSVIGTFLNTQKSYTRRAIVRTLSAYKLNHARLVKLDTMPYGFRAEIALPAGVTAHDFEHKTLEGLEQETQATGTMFKQIYGNRVEIKFGYKPLKGNYHDGMTKHPLAIPLLSPFGMRYLDFSDDSTCHILIGGATRMGKSVLMRLCMTHIYHSLGGKCALTICDHKVTDVHMFKHLPGVRIAETIGEASAFLSDILKEGYQRRELLKSKGNVIDVKSYRERYPDGVPMPPIFVFIDEYGRFSESDDIQNMVIEIAETMGYLDVHLIIASQRPDASQVLKPRIKANLLTRIAFTTSDEANSKLILDLPDAAKLGKIKGRALLLDGFLEKVQVPYMSEEQSIAILSPYRRKPDDTPRQIIDPIPEALPSFVTRPLGEIDLPGSSPPARNGKSNRKKAN